MGGEQAFLPGRVSLASSEMGQGSVRGLLNEAGLPGVPCKPHRPITDDLVAPGMRHRLELWAGTSGSLSLAAQFHPGIGFTLEAGVGVGRWRCVIRGSPGGELWVETQLSSAHFWSAVRSGSHWAGPSLSFICLSLSHQENANQTTGVGPPWHCTLSISAAPQVQFPTPPKQTNSKNATNVGKWDPVRSC